MALVCVQRNPTVPQARHVSDDHARRHAQFARPLLQTRSLTADGVRPFDPCLPALDPSQGQVSIAGGRSESDAPIQALHYEGDTGLPGLRRMMSAMTETNVKVTQFFDRYAAALLARDAKAIADMYAIPSLILFPGQSIPVSDAEQTEAFFAASWGQYDGVDAIDKQIVVMGEAPGSLWADVTWSYDGQPRERFCYQLVEGSDGYQIAVLTPMT